MAEPAEIAQRIADDIFPMLPKIITSAESAAIRARILRTVEGLRAERIALAAAAAERMETALRDQLAEQRASDAADAARDKDMAVSSARNEEQARCAALRQQDASSAEAKRLLDVAAARADEQNKCAALRASDATTATTAKNTALAAAETKRVNDVAAARADEQTKCAALRASDATAAAAAQATAVAAAKTSERTKCVAEIAVAPVTGITIALTLFSASMRDQIKAYVQSGPH